MKDAVTIVLFVALLGWLPGSGEGATLPSSPPQPFGGPGGSGYAHASVATSGPFFAGGHSDNPALSYFLFEPADPVPATAPVVLFLHGFWAMSPQTYTGWIEHMVRKGYVVVWVQYQLLVPFPGTWANNAMDAWMDALGRLQTGLHVRPAKTASGELKTAIVGHSAGGGLSAIVAARAADPLNGVPSPYAVVAVEPGGINAIPQEDLSPIPATTAMVVVVGNDDNVVCNATALSIWANTSQIPDTKRNLLLVRSDKHGKPAQIANHFFPTTDGQFDTAAVDARDFFVTYKLSVATLNCVFNGTDCSYALGAGAPEQIDMGQWSDGVPVLPMVWVAVPAGLQTNCKNPK